MTAAADPTRAPLAGGRTAGVSWILAAAALVLGAAVAAALLADWLAPFDIDDQQLALRLKPPSLLGGPAGFPLGTDELGRDILSRLLVSIRVSLAAACAGTLIAALVGTTLGMLAAHCRGMVDEAVTMLIDAQAAMPFLIVALAMLAFFGNSLLLFIALLGLNGWETYARLTRGLVLSIRAAPFVTAAIAAGTTPARIQLRHLLPNIAGPLIVQATFNVPGTMLLESGLSFLGLGIQPPLASLGLMLGSGREFLMVAWWTAVFPGIAIVLISLSISLLGDWLRDRLDPTTPP